MTLTKQPQTLDEFMALPWSREIQPDPDGGYVLTVWPLNDFAVFGASEEEVLAQWRDALRSHLQGYLKVGKRIPTGRIDVSLTESDSRATALSA